MYHKVQHREEHRERLLHAKHPQLCPLAIELHGLLVDAGKPPELLLDALLGHLADGALGPQRLGCGVHQRNTHAIRVGKRLALTCRVERLTGVAPRELAVPPLVLCAQCVLLGTQCFVHIGTDVTHTFVCLVGDAVRAVVRAVRLTRPACEHQVPRQGVGRHDRVVGERQWAVVPAGVGDSRRDAPLELWGAVTFRAKHPRREHSEHTHEHDAHEEGGAGHTSWPRVPIRTKVPHKPCQRHAARLGRRVIEDSRERAAGGSAYMLDGPGRSTLKSYGVSAKSSTARKSRRPTRASAARTTHSPGGACRAPGSCAPVRRPDARPRCRAARHAARPS